VLATWPSEKVVRDDTDSRISKILNPEQMEEWQKIQQENQARRRENMQRRREQQPQ
jgi:hypothetical protein